MSRHPHSASGIALIEPEEEAPAAVVVSEPHDEAFRSIAARMSGKTGSISADLLARHVLKVTEGADWPVQREAAEALLRRITRGRKDSLEISSRPAGGAVLGLYSTRRTDSHHRPYRTLLAGINPPAGSCDCPDFLRGSLGLCKHLLAILSEIGANPKRLQRGRGVETAPTPPNLAWDPIRPLRGTGDWIERVRWTGAATPEIRRFFKPGPDGAWTPSDSHASDFRRRHDFVIRLLKLPRLDPAMDALLTTERERLERRLVGTKAVVRYRAALRSLQQPLYPYQRSAVERFLASGRLVLADDMGLGKTAQAIAACHALWKSGAVKRGLILTPASLKPQWLREWKLFTDAPAEVVDGSAEERRALYSRKASGFRIANYEQLLRDLDAMHGWRPDLVVLDEAQRMKNWATKTAAYIKKLTPERRLVLTGTPMENRLEELASIVEWVDDHALEPKWRLSPWHATVMDGKNEIAGARNLDTLRLRLSGCMLRRTRREVLDQLPSRTDTRISVEMTPEQRDAHAELAPSIVKLAAIARKRPLTQAEFLRLMSLLTTQRIISNGLAQLRFEEIWPDLEKRRPSESSLRTLSSPKLLELREIVAQVLAQRERKIVIFSQWRRMLSLARWSISDVLDDIGARAGFFTGHEGPKRREQNIVDFHDDPDMRILFATDAGGVGLNLQRAANCCVNLELPWNPAVLEQRIGRIHRLGQKRPIDVYNFVCEEGIESRIASLVGDKQALFRGLFDGTSDQVAFDGAGNFMARVERLIEPAKAPDLPTNGEETGDADVATDREADAVVAAADESRDVEPEAPAEEIPSRPLPGAEDVLKLFSKIAMRHSENGGLVIEAPTEAASTLAALFEGLAGMLRGGSGLR